MSVIDKIQINSTTYDVAAGAGNVAYSDAATYPDGSAGKEISQLKSEIANSNFVLGEPTKNIFDPNGLFTAGFVFNNGVYSGTAGALHENFKANNQHYPLTGFKENTRYRISYSAKTDGNDGTTGSGIIFGVVYSDDTSNTIVFSPNSDTTYTSRGGTTASDKTVKYITISYGSLSANIWHIKDIQIEESTVTTDYVPYLSAVDRVARDFDTAITVGGVTDWFNRQIGIADFSTATLLSTYTGRTMNFSIKTGKTVKIDIVSSAGAQDTNTLYLLLYNGDTRLTPTAVYTGVGTRTVTFTNTYGADITRIDAVLVKVNEQNTYDFTCYVGDYMPTVVEDLQDDVDMLMGERTVVPSYFESELASAISDAKSNVVSAGLNGESFVFISDIHWEDNSKNSPALIRNVTESLPVENTIFCGDAFNGGTQAAKIADMNEIRRKFSAASPRFLSVFGNHDGNMLDGGTAFTNDEFYTLLQKQSDYYVEYGEPYYFYMDNPTTKTRFIFLDSRTSEPSSANDQLTWLSSITTGLNGWHFLVFVHVVYYPGEGGSWTDPTTWVMSSFMTSVTSALDAINTVGINKVEAIFGGHMHLDYNSATDGGIPIVLIDCDARQTGSGNPQMVGTVGEQAFDIVTVDYSAEKIYCVRVGRGNNRTINY